MHLQEFIHKVALLITESRLPHLSKRGFIEGPEYPVRGVSTGSTNDNVLSELAKNLVDQIDKVLTKNHGVVCIEIWTKQTCYQTNSNVPDDNITWPNRVMCTNYVDTDNFVLMEQWTLSIPKDSKPKTTASTSARNTNLLVKGIRSHLFYSQIRAVMEGSEGKVPENIVYKICSNSELSQFPGAPLTTSFPPRSLSSFNALQVDLTYQPSFAQTQLNNRQHDQSTDSKRSSKDDTILNDTSEDSVSAREKVTVVNEPRRNSFAEFTTAPIEELSGDKKKVSSNVREFLMEILRNVSASQDIDVMAEENNNSNDTNNFICNELEDKKVNGGVHEKDRQNFTVDGESKIAVIPDSALTDKNIDKKDDTKTKVITPHVTSTENYHTSNFASKAKESIANGAISSDEAGITNIVRHTPSSSKSRLRLFAKRLKHLSQSTVEGLDSSNFRRRSTSLESYKPRTLPTPTVSEHDTHRRYSLHLGKLQSKPYITSPLANRSTKGWLDTNKPPKRAVSENSVPTSNAVLALTKGYKFSPHRSRSASAPINLHESRLLGNFEESVLNKRLESSGTIDGFRLTLGVTGSSSKVVALPMTTHYYNISDNKAPSPYMGIASLDILHKSRYQVPRQGICNITIYNPHNTLVKAFKVSYDFVDMPSKSKTFLRQRTTLVTNKQDKQSLLYVIHLRFISSKSSRIYLHSEIKAIFPHNCNLKVQQFSTQSGEAYIETVTEGPTPRYTDRH